MCLEGWQEKRHLLWVWHFRTGGVSIMEPSEDQSRRKILFFVYQYNGNGNCTVKLGIQASILMKQYRFSSRARKAIERLRRWTEYKILYNRCWSGKPHYIQRRYPMDDYIADIIARLILYLFRNIAEKQCLECYARKWRKFLVKNIGWRRSQLKRQQQCTNMYIFMCRFLRSRACQKW